MKKKKSIITALSCVMIFTLLSACSNETKETAKEAAIIIGSSFAGSFADSFVGSKAGGILKDIREFNEDRYREQIFNYDDGYTDGNITSKGWENQFLNLKFSLPDGGEMMSKSELSKDDKVNVKKEMWMRRKIYDDSGQLFAIESCSIEVWQISEFDSVKKLKKDYKKDTKKCFKKEGGRFLNDGEMTIGGKKYDFITGIVDINQEPKMYVKTAIGSKGNKLIYIDFMYSPNSDDEELEKNLPELERKFDRIKKNFDTIE